MFLNLNSTLSPRHYWETNDDMDSRLYDPGWYYHKKTEGEARGILLRCGYDKLTGLFIYTDYTPAIIIAPYKMIPLDKNQNITMNSMLETIQHNYWKFRHDCWLLTVKRTLALLQRSLK